jgi:hypothetical protein
MERFTLREAAERTARSITTLRRYIRSGRLRAEKRYGRFGPEYFVAAADLAQAGLDAGAREPGTLAPRDGSGSLAPRGSASPAPPAAVAANAVPIGLYQDLQMKHEQLLVQYGMVRAGGMRAMELQAELEAKRRQLEETREELERRLSDETARLRKQLREARLELEGRALEIHALKEKVRALEMMTRNAVTTENIEKQFSRVLDQSRRVDRLSGGGDWGPSAVGGEKPPPDH